MQQDTSLRHRLAGIFRGQGLTAVLARGTAGSLGVSAGGAALQLLLHFVLTRWLGGEEYGVYVFLFTWVNVVVLVARLGLDTGLVRFVPQYAAEERWGALRGLLGRGELLVLGASLLLAAAGAAVVGMLSGRLSQSETTAAWLACASLPAVALMGMRRGALQGLKRVVEARLPEAVLRPLVLAALAALAWSLGWTGSALGATGLLLVATLAAAWVGHVRLGRALPPAVRRAQPEHETRHWLRVSLPLLLVSGMRQLLNQVDVLLVGLLVGRAEAGIYFLASRLAQLVDFGLRASNTIAAPMIAEAHARGRRADLQRLATRASWIAAGLSGGIALVLVVGRTPLLGLFGKDFTEGAGVLLVLVAGQLVNALTGPVGQLLNMTGHQDANARILAAVTALNLLLSFPAVVTFGIEGAAVVTSALVALKNLWTWWEVRRRLGVSSWVFGGQGEAPEEAC